MPKKHPHSSAPRQPFSSQTCQLRSGFLKWRIPARDRLSIDTLLGGRPASPRQMPSGPHTRTRRLATHTSCAHVATTPRSRHTGSTMPPALLAPPVLPRLASEQLPPPAWGARKTQGQHNPQRQRRRTLQSPVGAGLRAPPGNARSLDPPLCLTPLPLATCCPPNFSGRGRLRVLGERGTCPPPRWRCWARAGGSWAGGRRPAPLPPSRVRVRGTRAPSPPRHGARGAEPLPTSPAPAGQPPRSLAHREEDGVGRTYLSEFGAHQDEEEEAEELPGRLHVSLPRPPSWHVGALVLAPALRGRGRAPGSAGPAPSAPGASALHGERVLRAVPAAPGRARPSAAPPPALPHGRAWAGVPEVCEEGGRVAQRDPRATLTRGVGRAAAGRQAGTGCDIKKAGEI